MKKIFLPLLGAAALLTASMTSCKTANVTIDQVNTQLAGNWYFAEVNGQEVQSPEEEWPHLEFNTQEGRVSGNAGCNQLMGSFTYSLKGEFKFGDLASTRMMCPDMKLEDALSTTLPKVTSYSINTTTGALKFYSADGTPLVVLSRINPRTLMQYKQSY